MINYETLDIEAIHKLKENLREKPKILDLACGYGRFSCKLAMHTNNAEIVGVDVRSREKHTCFTTFHQLSLNDFFNIIRESFDVVLVMEFLHWKGVNQHSTLENAVHCLKPGGLILFKQKDHDALDPERQDVNVSALTDYLSTFVIKRWEAVETFDTPFTPESDNLFHYTLAKKSPRALKRSVDSLSRRNLEI
jgi:SAM-dependent methyltransferase